MRQHHTPMMNASADRRLEEQAQLLGFALSEPIKIGGQYTPVLRDGDSLYVSGQIPRVGAASASSMRIMVPTSSISSPA